MAMTARAVIKELKHYGAPEKARANARFFKTGKGQYGHGDVFLGVTVPKQKVIAKKFCDLPRHEIDALLQNSFHEARLAALLILVDQYKRVTGMERQRIVRFYLRRTKCVNNLDLVDSSAPQILGDWLLERDRALLDRLARSSCLWERRIAIVATQAFIRMGECADTFRLAKKLMRDEHDLIHKAVGWMLREVGKKDHVALETFLSKHASRMPRTMLRYAMEKFSKRKRAAFLVMRADRSNV